MQQGKLTAPVAKLRRRKKDESALLKGIETNGAGAFEINGGKFDQGEVSHEHYNGAVAEGCVMNVSTSGHD
ncbi:MAG: hypothetical protein C0402_05230 [Thermodesulfovibrio sp.]|nr:hypothetical protein [Thermodesulfovibrio sp.]